MIYDVSGNQLQSVNDVHGATVGAAYDVSGNDVFSGGGGGGGIDKYRNYTIEMLSYTTPCGQDFAYHNGKLVACTADNYLQVIDAETGVRLASAFEVAVGHANSLVFSDEFYSNGDTFPLLCGTTGGLSYFRVANSFDSAVLAKRFILQKPTVDTSTVWYGLGFHDGYVYTIGYTSGSYQQSANNFILLAKYDLKNPMDNGDDTYTLPIIYTKRREWFECIQGSDVHDGFMWVNSGFTNPGHVYALDLVTANILLDIPLAEYTTLEVEALSWADDSTLLIGSKNQGSNTGMFKITFPDVT